MSKAKAQSPESGDADDEQAYERQPHDVAVDFPEGVPATHRHDIRGLVYHITEHLQENRTRPPNVTKLRVSWMKHAEHTQLIVYYDEGCLSKWDVEWSTGRGCEEYEFRAFSDRVHIRLK